MRQITFRLLLSSTGLFLLLCLLLDLRSLYERPERYDHVVSSMIADFALIAIFLCWFYVGFKHNTINIQSLSAFFLYLWCASFMLSILLTSILDEFCFSNEPTYAVSPAFSEVDTTIFETGISLFLAFVTYQVFPKFRNADSGKTECIIKEPT